MKIAITIAIFCIIFTNGKYIQTKFTAGAFIEPPANTVAVVSYMHIAGAHFNLVFGGFSANTTTSIAQQLLKCHQFRIEALVGGYNSRKDGLPLCNDTSCMGYFVWDKPLPSMFSEIAKIVQTIRNLSPELLAYINLDSPSAHPSNLGVSAYDDYIQSYISTVDPDLLSFYNFVDFSVPNSPLQYENNLAEMNRYSRKYSLPFWNFLVSMPLTASSDPTTHQIEWQLYSSLAYNSKGILYYTFWNPYREDLIGDVGKWNGAIMRSDGTKSEHWETARVLNIVLRSWSEILMRVEYIETIHIHRDDNVENRLSGTPFMNLTNGFEYLLGVFHDPIENRTVVLLNNYDYCNRIWPTIVWDEEKYQIMLEVDKTRGILMPVFDASPQVPGFQLSFGAGEGRLFVFVPNNQ